MSGNADKMLSRSNLSSTRATSLAMVCTASLSEESDLSGREKSLRAYHRMKDCSSNEANTSLDVMKESASSLSFPSSRGISLTVTERPSDRAISPARNTALKPAPNCELPLGFSLSGIKHTELHTECSCLKCFSPHAVPRAPTACVMPMLCSRSTSGPPSTKMNCFVILAIFIASGRPNTHSSFLKIGEVREFIYLPMSGLAPL